MGVAFAGNLLTLFMFYEVLTLSTYPLVTHTATEEAQRAGRIYLGILLSTSIAASAGRNDLDLVAVAGHARLHAPAAFSTARPAGDRAIGLLLVLYVFGIGKAALMPFHRWLPAAMVAPTPVSALLHAVAVVKAGVFTVLKVVVYIFGIDFLRETGARDWLIYVAAATLLLASLVALTQGQPQGAARLFDGQPALLRRARRRAGHVPMGIVGGACTSPCTPSARSRCSSAPARSTSPAHKTEISDMRRHRPRHAGHHDRLPDRLAEHHRPAAVRRHLEQVVPGPRRARGGPDRLSSPC